MVPILYQLFKSTIISQLKRQPNIFVLAKEPHLSFSFHFFISVFMILFNVQIKNAMEYDKSNNKLV